MHFLLQKLQNKAVATLGKVTNPIAAAFFTHAFSRRSNQALSQGGDAVKKAHALPFFLFDMLSAWLIGSAVVCTARQEALGQEVDGEEPNDIIHKPEKCQPI